MSRFVIASAEAVSRQHVAFKRATDARMARRREGMRMRRVCSLPASEEMACPRCRERFLFGNECPECEVPLRSESLLPEVDEAGPRSESRHPIVLVLWTLIGGFTGVSFFD